MCYLLLLYGCLNTNLKNTGDVIFTTWILLNFTGYCLQLHPKIYILPTALAFLTRALFGNFTGQAINVSFSNPKL